MDCSYHDDTTNTTLEAWERPFRNQWMPEHGYLAGDACFACSHGHAAGPPYTEYVYIKLEKP